MSHSVSPPDSGWSQSSPQRGGIDASESGPQSGSIEVRRQQPDSTSPHFIGTPFYCYAYSFGQLLVLALYGMYKRSASEGGGAAFVPKYTALLESGGSLAPRELMKLVGVDIDDPEFWQVGFDELERLVAEAEKISGQVA